ncbi:MAG: HAMP domain-containing protein [Planctomycetes bacterium]|nr:HAMP domain-containing protein [Planctomycetota bacterium]
MPYWNLLRDMPVRAKLRTIIFLVSGVAVLGACAVFLTYQWISSRKALVQQLQIMAEIVADQSTAAVEFNQAESAALIVGSLKAERQIRVAALYSKEGRLFAHYRRDGADAAEIPAAPAADGWRFEGGELLIFQPLWSGGERVGTFHIRSDLSPLWNQLGVNVGIVGVVLVGAGLAILFMSGKLGKVVTDPVMRLAEGVRAVAVQKNYSVRVEGRSRDELGLLIDGFNTMLSQIQARDEALARAKDELEARVRERTRELESFSYSVSHDLRAPLRAIDGYSLMLIEDCADRLDANGRRYLDVIKDNTRKMGQLIDDLLAFSRMGRKTVETAVIDMGKMAREVFAELRPLTPDRPLELRMDNLPAGQGDAAMIRQVFANLLSNAIKYSRDRNPAIVEIGARKEGSETVYFVRDNGVGFEMQYAHKLFGVFQRLHSAREFEGTGVGLALVQRIVQKHGGRVWGEGEVGKGATFYFTLPDKSASPTAASREEAR